MLFLGLVLKYGRTMAHMLMSDVNLRQVNGGHLCALLIILFFMTDEAYLSKLIVILSDNMALFYV